MLTDFLLKKLDVFKISVLKSLKAAVQFKFVFVCDDDSRETFIVRTPRGAEFALCTSDVEAWL